MSIGSLDWPVQLQKILYFAYLNWSLLHSFLILFIQTASFTPSFRSFILQLTFPWWFRSTQDRGKSSLYHVLYDCT